jgi:hypothetical protein
VNASGSLNVIFADTSRLPLLRRSRCSLRNVASFASATLKCDVLSSKPLCPLRKLWHSSAQIYGEGDFEAVFLPTFSSVWAVSQGQPKKRTVKKAKIVFGI